MIRFVKGKLMAAGEGEIIVDNQGIGYGIYVPASLMSELPGIGEDIRLYTYLSVREDAMQLFGFLSYEDYEMFKLLITVNGIGPKAGLAILGTIPAQEICYAVMSEDAKTIARAPGIGPKTARKVILELKDKIDLEDMVSGGQGAETEWESGESVSVLQDAVEALTVLGYSRTEAAQAVHAVEYTEGMTVEEVLKQSLKNL